MEIIIEDSKLWRDYKQTKDPGIREKIIRKYAPFVKYIAGRVAINLPSSVEFDDLVSYGVLGLLDAIEKYDPDRKIKFKTYAKTRIRGAIFDELRQLDWTPRSIRQKVRALEKTYAKLEEKLGRPATDEEVAREMEIPVSEVYKLFNQTKVSMLLSLDEVCFDQDNKMERANFIQDNETENPQFHIEESEVKDILIDAINKLSERERLVVTLYYFEELTAKEIGKVLNVSDSRVSQLHTKAILRLRGRLSKAKNVLIE